MVPNDAEHEEGEVVGNRIDKEVIDDCRLCDCCRAKQCDHDVTGLSDGTVSHEAAEAALLECSEVSDEECYACEERDERCNFILNRGERAIDEHDEESDGGCLRGHGKHCGNWRRSSFIDIGCPSVEREKRKLETDSAEQEQYGNPQERVRTVCYSGLDFVEVEASGKTVEVAEAEQFKSRRDGAHQNVLGGGFGTELVAFVPSSECVHRDGRNFDAEEEREQVAGTHDCESAERRERDRSDEFGDLVHLRFAVSAVFKVILRKPHAEQSAHHEHFAHEHAEVIDFPVADEELSDSIVEGNQIQEDENGDKADVRHAPRNLGLRCHEKAYPDYDEREYQQQNVR